MKASKNETEHFLGERVFSDPRYLNTSDILPTLNQDGLSFQDRKLLSFENLRLFNLALYD